GQLAPQPLALLLRLPGPAQGLGQPLAQPPGLPAQRLDFRLVPAPRLGQLTPQRPQFAAHAGGLALPAPPGAPLLAARRPLPVERPPRLLGPALQLGRALVGAGALGLPAPPRPRRFALELPRQAGQPVALPGQPLGTLQRGGVLPPPLLDGRLQGGD